MISIDKLIQQLNQCKDTSISLPITNECEFVQRTAFEIRKAELELLNNNFQQLNEANYTMDSDLELISTNTSTNASTNANFNANFSTSTSTNSNSNGNSNSNSNSNGNTSSNSNSNVQYNNKQSLHVKEQIPSKSLIIYTENETANIPEIIVNLLKQNSININEWYIYGIKNPESFYKSFLLLSKLDFIIKNKTEKKNDVATFKREMAIQYENFYKTLNYRKLRFPRNEMVHNLTNVDNYTDFDALQFVADYSRLNFIILDIISLKYIDVLYTENTLFNEKTNVKTNVKSNTRDINIKNFVIIIKYASNTYLPLMNSNGNHLFNSNILDIISKNFERIVLNKLKEPRDCNVIDESVIDECESQKLIYNIETIMKQDYNDCNDNNNDDNDDNDDIIPEPIQYYGMKNSIDIDSIDSIDSINNLITLPTHKCHIEDMIDIGEQDEQPMGVVINKINANSANSAKNITITKPNEPTLKVEKQDSNDLASILSRVPMACDMKPKKGRTKESVNSKVIQLKNDKNSKLTNTSTSIPIEELLNHVSKHNNVENVTNIGNTRNTENTENKSKSFKEQLKPLAQYNLLDLQMLAKLHKIDTQKMGNCNKKINKLKAELYDDIKDKI